jgi:hypothetical protein
MGVSVFPATTVATQKIAEFTASGTWTCPTGVTIAEFLVVGAGGAGGGAGVTTATTRRAIGGGGGGGAVKKMHLSVTPGTAYTITVGAKGTGSAALAGGNGGFSEVLNSGTTLIRAYGGAGGAGITAAGVNSPRTAAITATGGGESSGERTGAGSCGGGGGGAAALNAADSYVANYTTNILTGVDGAIGKSSNGTVYSSFTVGGLGIDNYGGGGGGAAFSTDANVIALPVSQAPYGAGAGGTRSTSGVTAGSAALANTGGGGGGGVVFDTLTTVAGGNGSDGIVKVVYFG